MLTDAWVGCLQLTYFIIEWEFEDTGEFAFYKTGQEKARVGVHF